MHTPLASSANLEVAESMVGLLSIAQASGSVRKSKSCGGKGRAARNGTLGGLLPQAQKLRKGWPGFWERHTTHTPLASSANLKVAEGMAGLHIRKLRRAWPVRKSESCGRKGRAARNGTLDGLLPQTQKLRKGLPCFWERHATHTPLASSVNLKVAESMAWLLPAAQPSGSVRKSKSCGGKGRAARNGTLGGLLPQTQTLRKG